MTPDARRGRRLFLILATLTVLWKLGGVGLMVARHGHGRTTFLSLALALAVPSLWRGTMWLQRAVGVTFLLSGAMSLVYCVRSLPDLDVLGASVAFSGVLGLLDVLAGSAFVFLPDLGAFFRHQREGRPDSDFARRSLPVAAGWGLALGCGAGLLLAAQYFRSMDAGFGFVEVVVGLLIGVGVGGLAGVVAGLSVGAAGAGEGLTIKRLAVTRGLLAAGACMVVAVVLAAIYGGLFAGASPDFPADPGLPRAALAAVIWLIFGTPMVASAGFVLGVGVALIVREGDPEKQASGDWAEL